MDFSRTKVCVRKNRRPGLNVIKLFTAVIYYVRIKLECLSLARLSNCKGAMWVVLHPNWVKIYSPRQNIITMESLLMGKCQSGNPCWRSLSTDDLFVLTCLDWQHFLPFVQDKLRYWGGQPLSLPPSVRIPWLSTVDLLVLSTWNYLLLILKV